MKTNQGIYMKKMWFGHDLMGDEQIARTVFGSIENNFVDKVKTKASKCCSQLNVKNKKLFRCFSKIKSLGRTAFSTFYCKKRY